MHLVDAPGAGPGNTWVEESLGVPKTQFGAKFFNAVQDELVALLVSAGIAPSDASDEQVAAALDVLFGASGASALKSRIINGSFELWQRGASIVVGNVEIYTADRFAALADQAGAGVGAATIARQAFVDGQTDVPGDPPFFLRWTQTTDATAGAPRLAQKIEHAASLADGIATVSFYCRALANSLVTVRVVQSFGSGGSADVLVGTSAVPISTSWSRQQATFIVPDIAGKTLGAGSHLRVEFSLPEGESFTFDFANVQVEAGENATPFERRALALEYMLCARYFETSYPLGVDPGSVLSRGHRHLPQLSAVVAGGNNRYPSLQERFRVEKRARPTVSWYAVEGSGIGPGTMSEYGGGIAGTFIANQSVASVLDASERTTGVPQINSSVVGNVADANWTADAEL
jgi:hypothetical protein